MNSQPSIAGRAALAVALMIGFYVLALVCAAALFYVPYAEMTYTRGVHLKLALLCVFGGFAILWSILPRWDRFTAPGPLLTRGAHPRLFADLERIAAATGQAMPAEVYLVPDVNAWVSQRGGWMGFGSRRIMGLGLPLMRILTRSQFRGVLAHEFGHYHGGDTRVGPWIYKTRAAIVRTVSNLGSGSLLQLPFLGYMKMFLRVTHAISRRQEFIADALAARVTGAAALIDGLRAVHAFGPAYGVYWSSECAPVLSAGFRPPLTDGFDRFVKADKIAESIGKGLDEEMKTGKTDPYDTHPPLKERILALACAPTVDPEPEDPPATSLLEDITALELGLVTALAGADAAAKLQPIDWSETCAKVYLPHWRQIVEANAPALAGVLPEGLPVLAAEAATFGKGLRYGKEVPCDDEEAVGMARAVVGAALAVMLIDKGGAADSAPGCDISVSLGSLRCEPFSVLPRLIDQSLDAASWEQQCREFGILGEPLGRQPKA